MKFLKIALPFRRAISVFLLHLLLLSFLNAPAQVAFPVLDDLKINFGELKPSFDPELTSYTLIVPENIYLNELEFTPFSSGYDIKLNNQNVYSGSSWIPVMPGTSRVRIDVFDGDGGVRTYYIFIYRVKARLVKSDSLTLSDVSIESGISRKPKWMDRYGFVYATSGDTIFKSTDKGSVWDPIHFVNDSLKGGSFERSPLIVTADNRIIYCAKGKVIVSDEAQTNFAVRYNFRKESIPRFHLGYSAVDSIILLGTYENNSDTADVILSTNYGRDWKTIFSMEKPFEEYVFHIHDVEYDVYSHQILIVTGDSKNCQIYYSKNWGESWGKVFTSSNEARIHQSSQIICYPHGWVLGSDVASDGLIYIPRNGECISDYKIYNSMDFISMDDDKELKRYAVKQWTAERSNRNFTLLPWYHCIFPGQNAMNDYSRLWLSYNGIEWYELYRWQTMGSGLFGFANIVGPFKGDDQNTIFSNFHGDRLFRAKIKFPSKLAKVSLTFPESGAKEVVEAVFLWSKVGFAYDYKIQISQNKNFSDLVKEDSMIVGVNYYCNALSDSSRYYWRVKAMGVDGEGDWSEVHEFSTGHLVESNLNSDDEPVLFQNCPNPFSRFTNIYFYIPERGKVGLKIYDVLGRNIFKIDEKLYEPGVFKLDIDLENRSYLSDKNLLAVLDVQTFLENKSYRKTVKMVVVHNSQK